MKDAIASCDRELITAFELYLITQRCRSEHTVRGYLSDCSQFATFLHSTGTCIHSATAQAIQDFLQHQIMVGNGATTRSRKLSCIKSLYNFLSQRFQMDNPTHAVCYPKRPFSLPRYLTEQQVSHLLECAYSEKSIRGQRNWMIIYMLYCTGLRISELCRLRIMDIRLEQSQVTVHGKGDKQRVIPIPQSALGQIAHYIATVGVHWKKKYRCSVSYLFPVYQKGSQKAITRQACWLIIKKLWKKAGYKTPINPHMLRHSFATHLLWRGADLRSLQLLLGHEHVNTVQIYTHVQSNKLRDLYNSFHPRS